MSTSTVIAPVAAHTAADHAHGGATKRYVLGIFDDPDVLLDAIEQVRAAGTKIYDVFTPYPIHGIDDVLDIKRTRLPIAAFMFGCCGLSLALFLQIYMLWADWPMIIGGKPHYAFPSFVPVCFELTVLCTAFGMVITFFLVSGLRPKFKVQVMDRRSTDDKFVMAIEQTPSTNLRQLTDLLRQNGASEVNEKEIAVKH
jgi:hypothetical protein